MEFIEGCLRLQGEAKCIDVHTLIHQVKVFLARWSTFAQFVEERFLVLADTVGADMLEWRNSQLPCQIKRSNFSCTSLDEIARERSERVMRTSTDYERIARLQS